MAGLKEAVGVKLGLSDSNSQLWEQWADEYIRELEAILESDKYRGLRDDPEFCAGMGAVLDLLKGKTET